MRRAFLPGFVLLAVVGAAAAACDSSSSVPEPGPPEAGAGFDAGPGPGPGNDGGDPGIDGGSDAGADTGTDAGATTALFAHINQTLVSVNVTTGAVTDIGPTGQANLVFAWDRVANVARVVLDSYTPVGVAVGTPKLGTIDLCTGTVTPGPSITVGGVTVLRAEGFAQNPVTGGFHIAVGTSGTGAATQYLTSQNGAIDVTTGAVTIAGSHQTHQDDGDSLTFIGSSLRLLDVATDRCSCSVYTIDTATGAASNPVATGTGVLRIAHDPVTGKLFTAYGMGTPPSTTARSIGTLDPATGTNTPLGTVLAAGTYAGAHFAGLMPAPQPICP